MIRCNVYSVLLMLSIDFLGPLQLHRYTSHILGYNSQAIKISRGLYHPLLLF